MLGHEWSSTTTNAYKAIITVSLALFSPESTFEVQGRELFGLHTPYYDQMIQGGVEEGGASNRSITTIAHQTLLTTSCSTQVSGLLICGLASPLMPSACAYLAHAPTDKNADGYIACPIS